ncbi:hypothetical protein C9I98_24135 [Photobacterium sanctipauli]|uniref:Uncharacterized protein n=1 Tax=Photobacterium sanctipauli TaxID=1342794 RepID=A0A2T3NBJ7_9GAMM|nr:hypothetical protein [Photobacterium sanctipauli]PSW11342.1 hypothetical protein C9I98_24135 [Photobacterium sanctipauli]
MKIFNEFVDVVIIQHDNLYQYARNHVGSERDALRHTILVFEELKIHLSKNTKPDNIDKWLINKMDSSLRGNL